MSIYQNKVVKFATICTSLKYNGIKHFDAIRVIVKYTVMRQMPTCYVFLRLFPKLTISI